MDKELLQINFFLLFILVMISMYRNVPSPDTLYKSILISAGIVGILVGAHSKKYGKYADKLLIPILQLNIAILIYFSYLYDTGLNQIICITSCILLMFGIYKTGMRVQKGRLANPNTIITSGFIPFFLLWVIFTNSLPNWHHRPLHILILLIPLFFDLKYYFDFRAILLMSMGILLQLI